MSVQFLGLASGTDWNSVITQLVAIERKPLDSLIKQRDTVEFNRSVMTAVSDRLRTFNNTLSTMRLETTYVARKVEATNSSRVNATAEAGAAKGTYNIAVQRLARASRASSGIDGGIYSKVANLSPTQTMGINSLTPYGDFQGTRALDSTLIKDTMQAGQNAAAITKGDTISINGLLKDGTAVSGTYTFNGDSTDTLERLATAVSQVFHGQIAGSVGSNGELTFIESDPTIAGDVTFNTTVPPLGIVFNDTDYSGSTLTFGIGNNVAGAGGTFRRLVNGLTFTTAGAPQLNSATDLATLDQVTSGTLNSGDIIRITGTEAGGSAITSTDFTYTGAAGGQTIADLLAKINSAYSSGTATYENGKIVFTATAAGPSSLGINLEFVDSAPTTAFSVGNFNVAETGRTAGAQMVTTGSFTVQGKGEHILSSSDGKAGLIHGTVTLMDPTNTLSSYGVTEYDMLTIDVDGAAGGRAPVTITGMSEYSTLQDLVDAVNTQVPSVTARITGSAGNYRLEIAANEGGRDIRVYDAANGILNRIFKVGATDLNSASNDLSNTFASTTATTDATIIDWFRPVNGGPMQRRFWTGAEGSPVTDLIDGVAINGTGGAFTTGVGTVVTTDSVELNTQQDMSTYIFGSNQIALSPPTQVPSINANSSLAAAGFRIIPKNSDTDPLFHTNGFFSINGVNINVGDVNTTTINQVLGTINSSGAGVTAYFDSANSRFYLRSNTAGESGITLGGNGDTSNFLTIGGLLAASGAVEVQGQDKGNIDDTLPIAQSGFTQTPTSGVFTINGVRIAVDAGVDTIKDVITKINNSGAGVTASYDSVSDTFALEQKLTGSYIGSRIELGDSADTSNFLEAIQMTADTTTVTTVGNARETARFTLNGVAYERNTNTIDDVLDKVKLTLNALTEGSESITVSGDTERVQNAILDFVVQYNSTMELLNAKPLTTDERQSDEFTTELTSDAANNMTSTEIEDYFTKREALLTRNFLANDNSTRQVVRKIQDLLTGLVKNDGVFQSIGQIGLATAEVGAGVDAAAVSQGRLMGPTSDKDTLKQLLLDSSALQDAITNHDEDLYTLFANALQSRLTQVGTVNLSSGVSLVHGLNFTIGDGTTTATIAFSAGSHSGTDILNTINAQLNSSGLSSSMLAYFDSQSQLNLRVTQATSQSYLQLMDMSTGVDTMLGKLGISSGNYLGPDPSVAGGSALRTREYIRNITSSTGVINDRIKTDGSFDRMISTYNSSITRLQDNLDTYEKDLRNKFARLETSLSTLQTQSKALESAIASYNAQTSSS
jgi:flagellar hook-associated protein 2